MTLSRRKVEDIQKRAGSKRYNDAKKRLTEIDHDLVVLRDGIQSKADKESIEYYDRLIDEKHAVQNTINDLKRFKNDDGADMCSAKPDANAPADAECGGDEPQEETGETETQEETAEETQPQEDTAEKTPDTTTEETQPQEDTAETPPQENTGETTAGTIRTTQVPEVPIKAPPRMNSMSNNSDNVAPIAEMRTATRGVGHYPDVPAWRYPMRNNNTDQRGLYIQNYKSFYGM